MARKVVEISTCDPCAVKGETTDAVAELLIDGDRYDMCETHRDRFKAEFRKLFGAAGSVQKIA